jgi:hypothetical protein
MISAMISATLPKGLERDVIRRGLGGAGKAFGFRAFTAFADLSGAGLASASVATSCAAFALSALSCVQHDLEDG